MQLRFLLNICALINILVKFYFHLLVFLLEDHHFFFMQLHQFVVLDLGNSFLCQKCNLEGQERQNYHTGRCMASRGQTNEFEQQKLACSQCSVHTSNGSGVKLMADKHSSFISLWSSSLVTSLMSKPVSSSTMSLTLSTGSENRKYTIQIVDKTHFESLK